jgi:putative flippase GtrA
MRDAVRQALATPGVAQRAARFGISGLFVTGLHALIAASLIEFILPWPALANGIAFVVATFVSYMINTVWSFSQMPVLANLLRFLTVAFIGLLITMAISGTAAAAGFSYWIGIACVVLVVPPCTFLMHTFWTYR